MCHLQDPKGKHAVSLAGKLSGRVMTHTYQQKISARAELVAVDFSRVDHVSAAVLIKHPRTRRAGRARVASMPYTRKLLNVCLGRMHVGLLWGIRSKSIGLFSQRPPSSRIRCQRRLHCQKEKTSQIPVLAQNPVWGS